MDARDLYGLPLERFVPERNALSKTLRSQGRREEATRVAQLTKPSVAAWAVNQLVRTQAPAIARLFEAGDALRQAQADVLAGRGSAAALRQAAEEERSAVRALSDLARGLLDSQGNGLTASMLERVSETLDAAALEEGAREQVRDGCLIRELRHIGLGEGLLGAAPPAPGGRPRPSSPARREPRPTQAVEAEAARERAATLERARAAEAEARRAAGRAQRELRSATARRDRAADAVKRAELALEEANGTLGEAERAVREAEERAAAAATALEQAQQTLRRL